MIILLVVVLAVAIAAGSEAAIFNVDSTADAVDAVIDGSCDSGGGDCTLRAAIQEANASATVDDVINLPAGTYTLSIAGAGEDAGATGDLDILESEGDVTITGAGASTTIIDGGGLDRVLEVGSTIPVPCCAVAALSDVTIQSGNTTESGGGIYNSGRLTLTRVIIRDNDAFSGGGIRNEIGGTIDMVDSVITGNSASSLGGGISQFADSIGMTLSNVTISGNRAGGSGGGISSQAFGVYLNNVTVTDNTADSDANGSGSGGGVHSAFVVFAGGGVVFRNSIIAGNSDSGGEAPDCFRENAPASISSEGYNLIGDTTGCTITGDTTGNLTNVAPLLGPLDDNGGGTLTHALLAGSPAKDAANPAVPGSGGNACTATDQRGTARPSGPRCDMGAFEDTTTNVGLDHYKCYVGHDLNNPRFSQRTSDTQDQLTDESVTVMKLKFVCVPVDKNGEGVFDSATHIACYHVVGANLSPRPAVEVSTQFQTSRFELKRPKLLCAPATKTLLP